MEGFLAEIRMFGGNFAPRGWVFCNGQLLAIADWTAVFSLVGTTYGGNGTTTFGVPDLRGRVPVHPGTGLGLTNRTLGEMSGVENVTLLATNLPSHTHGLLPSTGTPDTASPASAFLPVGSSRIYAGAGPAGGALATASLGPAGSSNPHTNMMPFAVTNYIMCVEGIFPSRN